MTLSKSFGTESTVTQSKKNRQHLVLENDELRAEFSRQSGALVHLVSKQTNWTIHHRPELGRSFQLLVPLPDRRNNRVLGEQQTTPSIAQDVNHRQITFTWNHVTSEHAGKLDIRFVGTVRLSEHGLGVHRQGLQSERTRRRKP